MTEHPDGEDDFSLRMLEEGDPHYASIGRVAYAWTAVETMLDGLISDLVRAADDEATQCLLGQFVGPGPRIRALIALARFRGASEALVTSLNKFGRECTELGTKRNRIVHDMVVISMTTGRSFAILGTADRKLEYGYRERSVADMQTIAKQIEDLTEAARQVYYRAIDEIGTPEQKEKLRQLGILPLNNS